MAMKSSNGMAQTPRASVLPRTHERKQDDVSNRETVRQQHDEAIDTDALTPSRRQSELERPDVVLVHLVRLGVSTCPLAKLVVEPPPLFHRIVELAERVRHLEAADVQLEPFNRVRIVGLLL